MNQRRMRDVLDLVEIEAFEQEELTLDVRFVLEEGVV
jgi:hypothetical protein